MYWLKKFTGYLLLAEVGSLGATGLFLEYFPGISMFVRVPVAMGSVCLGVFLAAKLTDIKIKKENRERNSQQERQGKEGEERKEEKEREERGRGKEPGLECNEEDFNIANVAAEYDAIEAAIDLLLDTQKNDEGPKNFAEQLKEAYAFQLQILSATQGNDKSAVVSPLAKSSKQMTIF